MRQCDVEAFERVKKWCGDESLSVTKSDVRLVVAFAAEYMVLVRRVEAMMEDVKHKNEWKGDQLKFLGLALTKEILDAIVARGGE